MTSDTPVKAGRREWTGLAVLALGSLAVSFDVFVMLLALPHLTADLKVNGIQQLWAIDIYGFMVGGLLITMGSVGDRIGRRKLLIIGAAAFGVASVLAAYSTSPGMLIACRALLGIAGATLGPSTLALITNMFRDPKQMGSAIGIWAGSFTVGAIIGPILGGVMLDHFWWGSVFLLGVPAMVLLVVLGPILLPEYRNPDAGRPDFISVAMSLAAILPAIYGIKQLARNGWQAIPIVAVVVGVVFGVLFLRRQRRLADPLLDLTLFRSPAFSTPLAAMLFYSSLTGATMVFVTQHFQSVEGLSPLRAGLAMLPGLVLGTVSVTVAPMIARKIRPALLVGAGLVVTVVGLVILTQAGTSTSPTTLVLGYAVWCLGGGPLLALGMNLVMSSTPPEKAGSAGSLSQISNELGYALGIGTVGAIGTLVYRTQVSGHLPAGTPAAAAKAAHESVAGAVSAAPQVGPSLSEQFLEHARQAFTDGLQTVAAISALLLLGVAVWIAVRLRHIPPIGAPQGAPAEPEGAEALAVAPQESA